MQETLEKEQLFRKLLKHPKIKSVNGKGLMLAAIMESEDLANHIILYAHQRGYIFFWLLFEKMSFSSVSQTRRYVQIQIPAELDYEVLFEAIFETACKSFELTSVQSADNKFIKLDYVVDLKPDVSDQRLIQRFLRYEKIKNISFSKEAKKRKTL